ncbi:T9SS type A sorting domain-containing protein [Haliscomenobacter hydrossis]|uniref:Carbohydrate-binding CenC domain protein n=1 Tax=Haliscomenobacter hydrossis (strain ATCC 27775 / DSM 1100 / LMG 10767 / O) TaxID=760192 RepID=F4KRM6_HALH1|nr:T9SS type A sorting domain-containing protein [Haliscomenobacter hydrossis]AEE49015.1 Carbohydrate-binding CenC domain protein [Haliscomenobacter hydrossis DSM 1100]
MKKHLLFFAVLLFPLLGMAQVVLEDFEGGAKLPWTALDGTYSSIDNPAGGNTFGVNSSAKVGSYTKKAGAGYSLFLAELPTALDLSTNNLFKIQVKAAVASAFILKLEGTSGFVEATKNIAIAGEWIEYSFDFSKAAATPNLKKIILFFDPGVDASADTYLFDNLTVSPAGPCAGVAPSANILDDFECQRNIAYGLPGFADISAVDNPDKTGINTSASVGRYKDTGGEFHAMVLDWGGAMPLATRNVVKIKVWAPVAGNMLVKMEAGTSPQKELTVPITEINKWVEYTVDFSSQAAANHTKLVFFFNAGKLPGADDIYYIDDISLDPAPTSLVYEDFEGGAKLNWNPIDGSFVVVPNPPGGDTLKINSSTQVGAYTKKAGAGYSLFQAELAQPIDLSIYNVFKVQVKTAAPTSVLLKLEGPNGFVEGTNNIAVKDQWVEYSFNFSKSAALKGLNKIILFFDPGVDASADTYLFDNLIAVPAGACAGVEKNPDILDDFECQRNIAYAQPGFDDITAVDNPDKFGANLSAKVGRYKDVGGEFHALVMDWGGSIPLKDRNQVKVKVWAPVAGNLLFKLEGGTSGGEEESIAITELNKWVEYTADFSSQENANHTKIVFFFNAGKLPGANDIYYVDDISLVAKEKSSALEDFEDGAILGWESLGADAVFGKYNGDIPNPDKVGNTSSFVGSYTKGSSKLGGLKALLPQGFTLADLPQVNLQVWAPTGAKNLTLRLISTAEGVKEIIRPIDATGKWVDLNFNFSNFKNITDFERVEIVFDADLTSTATWYFDNLTQTVSTVNLCEGVVAVAGQVDDFECQRNYSKVSTTGGDFLKVINNPDPSGINASASDKVGAYTDPKDEYSAIVYEFGQPIDLSVLNQLQIKIWSPKAVPLLFKLEGGTQVEVFSAVAAGDTRKWVQYSIDLSAGIGKGNTKLTIFFNVAQLPTENDVYYIDDLEFRRAPYTSCISNFETALDNLGGWQYFANGTLDGQKVNVIVDNPSKTGINTSNKVAEFIERPGGEPFAGYFNDALPASISMGTNKKVTMKVLMDHEADVVLKLERSFPANTAPNTGDTKVKYTTPNQWQELTWDFTTLNIPNGAVYTTLSIIMDFGTVPTTEKRYYFDDLAIGDKSCSAVPVGVRDVVLANLKVYPNPVISELIIENGSELYGYDVFNALGQKVYSLRTSGQSNVNLNTSNLEHGMYILAGYDKNGLMKAKTKFVKQ